MNRYQDKQMRAMAPGPVTHSWKDENGVWHTERLEAKPAKYETKEQPLAPPPTVTEPAEESDTIGEPTYEELMAKQRRDQRLRF